MRVASPPAPHITMLKPKRFVFGPSENVFATIFCHFAKVISGAYSCNIVMWGARGGSTANATIFWQPPILIMFAAAVADVDLSVGGNDGFKNSSTFR